MSWTDCACEENLDHSDTYSECLMCEINRMGEYSAFQDREISRLAGENRLLGNQVARLQSSTGACEQIRKDQMIEDLIELISEAAPLSWSACSNYDEATSGEKRAAKFLGTQTNSDVNRS